MRYAVISLTANTAGSIALFFLFRSMGLMPHLGIALATTLGGWLNAGLLWRTLSARGHFIPDARFKRALPRMVLASVLMGIALWLTAQYFEPWFAPPRGILLRSAALAALVGVGLGVYGVAALALGAVEWRQLRSVLRRGAKPTPPGPV